jgi:hypothetical protein
MRTPSWETRTRLPPSDASHVKRPIGKAPWIGLVAVDIADFGRRYMVSDRPAAWFLGFASHLANSVLLVLLWACLIEPNLSWPRWLEGAVYGEFHAIFLAGSLVAPMAGLGFLGRRTGNASFALTSLLIHLVWGLLVGAIYVPR